MWRSQNPKAPSRARQGSVRTGSLWVALLLSGCAVPRAMQLAMVPVRLDYAVGPFSKPCRIAATDLRNGPGPEDQAFALEHGHWNKATQAGRYQSAVECCAQAEGTIVGWQTVPDTDPELVAPLCLLAPRAVSSFWKWEERLEGVEREWAARPPPDPDVVEISVPIQGPLFGPPVEPGKRVRKR